MADILVLYDSQGGAVRRMAELVADGIGRVHGAAARLCTVPRVAARTMPAAHPVSDAERRLCIAQDKRLAEIALKLVA